MMNALESWVQWCLQDYYNTQEEGLGEEDRGNLVSILKLMYSKYSKERARTLVPFDEETLQEKAVKLDKDEAILWGRRAKYVLLYQWNNIPGMMFSEFVEDEYTVGVTIPQGTLLDRIGNPDGQYLCPVPSGRFTYSAAERALPYYLLEEHLEDEPAYHRYVAVYNITKDVIRDQLLLYGWHIYDPAVVEYIVDMFEMSDIVHGTIASVEAFGEQGVGGGIQYRMPLPIQHLVQLGLLKEVKRW